MRISGFKWKWTRKLRGSDHQNWGITVATANCNTLIDVFGQHFNKNFRLRHVFLQAIIWNTNFTLLKYQNGWFSIISMHSFNTKFVIISHIYTFFQYCLFNLSAFCAVILEFWRKNQIGLKLIAALFQCVAHIRGCMITVITVFMQMYSSLWPDTFTSMCHTTFLRKSLLLSVQK